MIPLRIHISKPQTLHAVEMTTAYQAVKNDDAAHLFDRVAVVGADHSLLETFWHDSCVIAHHTLQEYRQQPTSCPTSSTRQDDDFHALLLMPENWDDTSSSSVVTSLQAFFVAYMLERWMALVWPEASTCHALQAATHKKQVLHCLEARKRKPRPQIHFLKKKSHEKENKDNNNRHPSVEAADDL
ncbi:MAG: hypothetical protein IKH88_06890 [Prevotella sp.]|nr:hypothetical protein [Prevotella sp.]